MHKYTHSFTSFLFILLHTVNSKCVNSFISNSISLFIYLHEYFLCLLRQKQTKVNENLQQNKKKNWNRIKEQKTIQKCFTDHKHSVFPSKIHKKTVHKKYLSFLFFNDAARQQTTKRIKFLFLRYVSFYSAFSVLHLAFASGWDSRKFKKLLKFYEYFFDAKII